MPVAEGVGMGHVAGLSGRGDAICRQHDVCARHLHRAIHALDAVDANGRGGCLHSKIALDCMFL